MNLLLFRPEEIAGKNEVEITGRRAEHLWNVLRAKPGDLLKAGVLGGNMGQIRLLENSKHTAKLELLPFETPPPLKRNLIPVISLPRPQSFKKTLHFIASAGIARAFFIHSARVEKSFWNSDAVQPDSIMEELVLGLEQGRDTILPQLEFRRSFRDFFLSGEAENLTKERLALIAHPVHAEPCPYHVQRPVVVAIGPEGGYVPEEVERFQKAGYLPVEIGANILRVEFALSYLTGRLT